MLCLPDGFGRKLPEVLALVLGIVGQPKGLVLKRQRARVGVQWTTQRIEQAAKACSLVCDVHRQRVTMAARFGLAALDHRDLG